MASAMAPFFLRGTAQIGASPPRRRGDLDDNGARPLRAQPA